MRLHRSFAGLLVSLIFHIGSPLSNTNTLLSFETLRPQSNRTLVSPGDVFELGFFSHGSRWYIGIWYKNIAQRTYVWVANRDNPLLDSNGSFGISETNLVIRDQVNALVWSTELRIQTSPVVAELLDNGNFVLRSSNHLEDLLWQSFDFPTDTLLPHMQLGLDPKSFLTSWKSLDDPSSGDYKFKLETEVSPKLSVWDKGGRLYDSGPWNGYKFNKLPPLFNLTRTRVGPTCLFIATNETSFSRLVMAYTGLLIQYTWNQSTTEWDWSWSLFNHICDLFNRCGSNAYCDVNVNTKQFCNCIEGFEPRNSTNMTDGCTRKTPLKCGADKFIPLVQMSFPYTANTSFPGTSDIQECQDICVVRCKCTAFSITHNLQSGSLECVTWTGELLDLRRNFNASQKIYIKLDGKKKKKKNNEIGHGGFGKVYKGLLHDDGEEIAVKKLLETSTQGISEFQNEVKIIASLQHINLVRLLGWSTYNDEKVLIYEYLENGSLEDHLFGGTQSSRLNWETRFGIINGIARGLEYIQEESRVKIVHRDLKPANILLDRDMVPKISDFGLARICRKNEDEALTTASPGTYGYMSPEYAGEGKYSKKSDVYSFGVIVLEIVSGKKNRTFSLSDPNCANLLSHVWINWMNGSWEKIVDEIILHDSSSQSRQILRCIEIGLLCVQKLVQDRPNMSSVVMMLGNETSQIPKSKTPGFYIGKSPDDPSSSTPEPSCSVNQCTVTNISPR